MALEPKLTHTFPSERNYFDESTSTKTAATIFDPSKTGADYGIKNIGKVQPTVPVTGVTVSPTTKSLAVGATQQITVTIAPSDATIKTVTYESSDPTKATVSATGLITAVAEGTATITVTTDDGAKTATVVVTVTA